MITSIQSFPPPHRLETAGVFLLGDISYSEQSLEKMQ
jgi:hypothetical protein